MFVPQTINVYGLNKPIPIGGSERVWPGKELGKIFIRICIPAGSANKDLNELEIST